MELLVRSTLGSVKENISNFFDVFFSTMGTHLKDNHVIICRTLPNDTFKNAYLQKFPNSIIEVMWVGHKETTLVRGRTLSSSSDRYLICRCGAPARRECDQDPYARHDFFFDISMPSIRSSLTNKKLPRERSKYLTAQLLRLFSRPTSEVLVLFAGSARDALAFPWFGSDVCLLGSFQDLLDKANNRLLANDAEKKMDLISDIYPVTVFDEDDDVRASEEPSSLIRSPGNKRSEISSLPSTPSRSSIRSSPRTAPLNKRNSGDFHTCYYNCKFPSITLAEVAKCQNCPREFHKDCAKPGLCASRRTGPWWCSEECKEKSLGVTSSK
eukprot:1395497-Amorphochlora_amoeboformis.AAC.2